MNHGSWIAVLDFGSQYTQLIARRIRELHVYSEILRFDTSAEALAKRAPAGIIVSGGPSSVFDKNAPLCDPAIFDMNVPVLGICYGMQLAARTLGGCVRPVDSREYGSAELRVVKPEGLLSGMDSRLTVWMSHGDQVSEMPEGFECLAKTDTCPVAVMADKRRKIFGLQFHPEVVHTPRGVEILKRFAIDICGCAGDWRMTDFIESTVSSIRARVGDDHVVCGLSGGVDSSVAAVLLHRAIGKRLHCIFVDNGVLRRDEAKQVEETFAGKFNLNLSSIAAGDRFFAALRGLEDPEAKRKAIGRTFIEVFAGESKKLGDVKYLAQGTLYPDVIESVSPLGGPSVTIKSHHNVGGLPEDMKFELIEPLRELFKDEAREVGRELGLPDAIVNRQPFPGPGLAVRILGEVTPERVALLQQADARIQQEMKNYAEARNLWQAFAVLLPVKSVGVMGDGRTYENAVVLRAVTSLDGMTADWARLPYDLLAGISNRIINEVKGVNRVVYDISSKPPATIEWE